MSDSPGSPANREREGAAARGTTWGLGDYPRMAARLEPAAIAAVELAAVANGDRVLDVATGTGNAALMAAEHAAQTVGVDFEPSLLRVAECRSRKMGRDVLWLEGDATSLPLPSESVDVVLSVFGVMYAADHLAAARELARVAAPHARIVLAAWTPGSLMAAMGHVLSPYLPPPPLSTGPPSKWGDRDELEALLAASGLRSINVHHQRVTLPFESVRDAVDFLVGTAGHVMSEKQRLTTDGRWDELLGDLATFVEARAAPVEEHLELALDYLLTLAVKGGVHAER